MRAIREIFLVVIGLVTGLSTPLWGQINISGKSGLMYIPSADVQEEGTFTVGYAYSPSRYAIKYNRTNSESIYFISLVVLSRLEINVNLLRPNGMAPRSSVGFAAEGIGDRQIDLKYVFMTEKTRWPSVALILSAPFGIDNSLITNALVATKHVKLSKIIDAGFTVGMGSPYSLYRSGVKNEENSDIFTGYTLKDKRDKPYYYLAGPFGGVNLSVANKAGLMFEWDSQHVNIGLYARLVRHWTLQAGLVNGDQLTFGTSYSLNLLQLPKRLSAKHSPAK
ncbi:YjbH domain-containing protein [Spirosoma fluviale]|uniref:Exopolysaccharide biosynthesis protein YbjH n=1 Tax=Spirosoma fluviale TaxID=1597977 RepID=A0A286GS43_9BACT|nr:YjbH domain-containing protein [Spirosoma fluviale]SOD98340.1 Exopolysaccharide biosynthesis protein YbjH [Spirosoma fluviale]